MRKYRYKEHYQIFERNHRNYLWVWGDDSPTHLFDLRFNTFNEINIQVEWEGLQ
jgi:hypothetical protein